MCIVGEFGGTPCFIGLLDHVFYSVNTILNINNHYMVRN